MSVLGVTGANDMGLGARQHKAGQQDREAGQDEDFQELQAAAMQRVTSQKVVVPTPSRKNMKEFDVRKLTRSQKNMVLDQALQVPPCTFCSCTLYTKGCKVGLLTVSIPYCWWLL